MIIITVMFSENTGSEFTATIITGAKQARNRGVLEITDPNRPTAALIPLLFL